MGRNSQLRLKIKSENEGQNGMGRRKQPDNTELEMKGCGLFLERNHKAGLRVEEEGSAACQAGNTKRRARFMDFKAVLRPSENPEKFTEQDAKNISRY